MKEKTLIILNKTFQHGFGVAPFVILRNPKIPHQLKALYLLLLSYAWYNAQCFPGRDTLAEDLGLTVDGVDKQLRSLKELNLIDWKQRGLNKTNIYYLLDIPNNLIPLNFEADSYYSTTQDSDSSTTPTIEVDEELINGESLLEEKLLIRKQKPFKRSSSFGNYPAPKQYPEKKKMRYIDVGDVR